MNVTPGRTRNHLLGRIKPRYVLSAAAIVFVAVVSISGAAGPQGRGASIASAPVPAARAPIAETISRAPAPHLLVYIAGSRSEKEALQRDTRFSEWFNDPLVGLDPVVTRIIVIGPGEEESLGLLAELVPEAGLTTGAGPRMTLVDVR